MEPKDEVLPIKGMRCSKCVSVIERVLMEVDGVESVSVNLAKKQASIKYDSSKVNTDYINRELKTIGYEIGHDSGVLDKIKSIKSLFKR